jgi:predicted HicB family RNase H-like nuclease
MAKFVLRIDPETYAWLKKQAQQERISINSLLLRMVDEKKGKEKKHGARA